MNQLKEEFSCESLDEADELFNKMNNDLEKLEETLKTQVFELEEEMRR